MDLLSKRETQISSTDLIELSPLLRGPPKTTDGQLLGQSLQTQKIKALRAKSNKLNLFGFTTLLLGCVSAASLVAFFKENEFNEAYKAVSILLALSAMAVGMQFWKYYLRPIPSLTEQDIIASSNPNQLRCGVAKLEELRRRKCELFVHTSLGEVYKVPEKVLLDRKLTLLLLGGEDLKSQLTLRKKLVHGRLCVRRTDVLDLISKSPEGEGKHSRFSPYLIAFSRNKNLQKLYFQNADNWHNPDHKDFRMELKKPWGVVYDRLLKHIYLENKKFNDWTNDPEAEAPDNNFEKDMAVKLGMNGKPVSGRKILEFRKLQHNSLDSFLKERQFVDESLLPKFEEIKGTRNQKT